MEDTFSAVPSRKRVVGQERRLAENKTSPSEAT
jgi:hypothetical protein